MFSSAAVQPLYGQLADLWGRRWLMIGAVSIFTLGSGICGGANTSNMLIGGRAIQGIGAAGINMLVELIICDLLPLRERGQFIGMIFVFVILGSVVGPFLGGVMVQHVSWRWAFYINLPFGGASIILLFFVLHVNSPTGGTFLEKMKRVDLFGNLLLSAAVASVLYALTYGGTRYNWTHASILATLILGLSGHVLFLLFEMSRFCPEPVMPSALFKNRTTMAALIATFFHTIASFWALYFLPLYFQSVHLVSPTQSGLQLLPFSVIYVVAAMVGGTLVTKLGRFRIIHFVGFALMNIAMGTFTILGRNTPIAVWVILQIIFALGLGVVMACLLSAVQASLPDSLNAASTGTFAFVRSIGTIWGVSIPAAIFNNRFDQLLPSLGSSEAQAALSRGQAYEQASQALVDSFPEPIRSGIISLYEQSLQRVWQIGIVFTGVGFLVIFIEKNIELRDEHEAKEFGLVESVDQNSQSGKSDAEKAEKKAENPSS